MGDLIYNISKDPAIKTIVEIGTWNGLGTTKCIHDAILESGKRDFLVLSLEADILRHNEAKSHYPIPLKNFNLIYGTIVKVEEILPKMNNEGNAIKHLPWLMEEANFFKTAPYVLDLIPEKIDFLILDGGEYSSSVEFEKLWERSHFIALDDTRPDMVEEMFGHILKNSMQRLFVLDHPEKFRVIEDNQNKGSGGWFVCEHLI